MKFRKMQEMKLLCFSGQRKAKNDYSFTLFKGNYFNG